MRSIAQLQAELAAGTLSRFALVSRMLERAADRSGQGARAFTSLYSERALAEAAHWDAVQAGAGSLPPLAGIPVSIKDLFDVAGETTRAGSRVLAGQPVATRDAIAVARLREAGAAIVGKTNMTEFAFSGLGLNPHHGTPLNPWDRARGRIPGGSSSGAAVSVSDAMAAAGVGTDTGGSARIPAALCGLTGFKPTAHRVPLQGVLPLSPTLDSVGSIARTVTDCALLDAVLAGEDPRPLPGIPASGLRIAVPREYVLQGLDATVARGFERALRLLGVAGVHVADVSFPDLESLPHINAKGGFPAIEAWRWHRSFIERAADLYDPRVLSRIRRGAAMSEGDLAELRAARIELMRRAGEVMAEFDALAFPTVPLVAPELAPLEASDAHFAQTNMLMLRNPSVANFLDACSLSLPCQLPGEAPVGFMLTGKHGDDRRLLALGETLEAILSPRNESS